MTTVATEIETFYFTRVGASFNTTKSFLKHYHFWAATTSHFPVFFLLWLLLLGFWHLFLFQTDNDEPLSLALIPHSLSKDDVIVVLYTAKFLYYKSPIFFIQNLQDQVFGNLNILDFFEIKVTCYHICHYTTSRICSGICLSNTKGKNLYSA